MTEPVEFSRGNELLQQLIRGDAVIGLIPDPGEMLEVMGLEDPREG